MNISEEAWKDIPGFEGYYQASSLGRVKSLRRKFRPIERILRPRTNIGGYPTVGLSKKCQTKKYMVHRLVMYAFKGGSTLQCNHKDSNRSNNHIDNLEWVTPAQNIRHAMDYGYMDKYGNTRKIDNVGVIALRDAHSYGHTVKQIAKYFKVCEESIYRIVNRVTYADLK